MFLNCFFIEKFPSSLRKTLNKKSKILMTVARNRAISKLPSNDCSCRDSFCLEVVPPNLKSNYFEADSDTFTLDLKEISISNGRFI